MSSAEAITDPPAVSGYEALLLIDQRVLDAIPTAVYVCDAEGLIRRYNRKAIELWGRAPKIGDPEERYCGAARLYHPDGADMPHAMTPMAAALRSGDPVHAGYAVIEQPGGRRITVCVDIQPMTDASGRVEGAINCFHDVTDRMTAERRLEASEQRFRDVLNALPAAVYTTDPEGRITFYNRAVLELCGREPALTRDRWCVSHRLYRPDGAQLRLEDCPMAVALAEQQPVRGVEIIAERPDGSRTSVMPFPTPLYDPAGGFAGAVNMLVDIGPLKAAEEDLKRRAEEQAALYRFTDRLYRARTMEEVYDAGLEAIVTALRCERASILLFDADGVMQFVAWRGLSDGYRAAVAGHTPWKPGETDPQPIWVSDIDETDESDALKAVVRREDIRGLSFIPLVVGGGVAGKFMAYYREAHAFTASEMDLAITIARQLGFSLEQRRAEEARRAADAQRNLLIHELNHRVKNTLATVQSLAMQTLRNADQGVEARERLDARLTALSRAHDILTRESWQGALLEDVVDRALEPFRTDAARIAIAGPQARLSPKQALAISIALHELATNAAKYGALSEANGQVGIAWTLGPDGELELAWRESGGPRVSPPSRSGFGSRLIERSLASELGAPASIAYRPEGVEALIRTRLEPQPATV